ncbi:MAG: FkbM family methyltransferase [Abitibacteriaceae bacterium]|nr:FkbM family methyltransferase [Abditibacteriaceae bacterium]
MPSSNNIKTIIKHALWTVLKDKEGLTPVTVITGPSRGTKLRVDIRTESAYWLGTYDRGIVNKLTNIIKPGQIVYDCGAFLGYYASVMRKAVGATGQVHIFEASSHNYSRVARLPSFNHWTNVYAHHLAIGEAHSCIRFASNLGAASGPIDMPGKHLDLKEVEVEEVQCCGIDELVYERGLPPPQFLKLDLETGEYYALLNGSRLWKEHRPTVLVELHKNDAYAETHPAFEAAERFLDEFSYNGVEIHLDRPVRSVADFRDAERQGVQCTILATPA